MVFDTWVECEDRLPGLKTRVCRVYSSKARRAIAADGPENAALAAFSGFVRESRNDKFRFRRLHVLNPETGAMRGYHVAMRDGHPVIRRTQGYGEKSAPDEIAVPNTLTDAYVYDEALQLAREWQAAQDHLDAARYAAYAAQAQKKKEGE